MVPNFFYKKLYASLRDLATLLETRIKTEKILLVLELNQLQWLKTICRIQHTKKNICRTKMLTKMEKRCAN